MPRWLWIAAIFLGFVYLFIIPPFQIADEPEHLARAYQLAQGKLYAEKKGDSAGGVFAASIANGLRFLSRVPHHGEQRVDLREVTHEFFHGLRFHDTAMRTEFYPFSNMALYSPVPYMPQMIAMGVASAFNLTIVQGMYLARIFTFAAALGIIFFALSLLGVGGRFEWQLFLLLSLPMALSQMASASADSICLALVVLNLALMARVFAEPADKKWFGFFLTTTALLSLSKLVFFAIPLAALIPMFIHALRSRGVRLRLLPILLAAVLPNFLWSMAVRPLYVPARLDAPIHAFHQLSFVREAPMAFWAAVWTTLQERGGDLMSQFVGTLGWLDVPVRFSQAYFFIFLGGVIALPKFVKRDVWGEVPWFRVSALFCALISFFLVFFSQYLAWTPLGAGYVAGVVGRYFIPLAPLVLAALPSVRFRHRGWEWIFYRVTIACWFFIHTKAVWAVLRRYWLV